MCHRHLVWNTSSFCWIVTVVFQHSAPYWSTLNTLLLKILILVWTLRFVALSTDFSMAKVWLAVLILVLISWLQSPTVVTKICELFNVFEVSSINQFGLFTLVFFLRPWIFIVFTSRQIALAVLLRRSDFC